MKVSLTKLMAGLFIASPTFILVTPPNAPRPPCGDEGDILDPTVTPNQPIDLNDSQATWASSSSPSVLSPRRNRKRRKSRRPLSKESSSSQPLHQTKSSSAAAPDNALRAPRDDPALSFWFVSPNLKIQM